MQFPDSYFESEVREGFYVPSMIKRVWAAQLEILEDIDKVCKKYNIPYYADWGTMLGAVRHGGYIPWDDDMDIGMKREDYRRFIAIAQEELPEGYRVLNTYTTAAYEEIFTRVVNGTHIDLEKKFLDKFHGCPYVMGVDVFPLDYLAPNREEEEYRCELIRMIKQVREILKNGNCDESMQERYLLRIEEMCNAKIERDGSIEAQLYQLIDKLCGLYAENEAEELTLMPLWLQKGKYRVPKNYYQNSVLLPFENTKVPVPALYDMVMERKYGDYMKLVRDAGAHDYPFYREQEQALERRLGRNPYQYTFSAQDLDSAMGERRKSHRSLIREQLRLLDEVSSAVRAEFAVELADDGQNKATVTADALSVLAECQNTAICLGTLIEELKGEGTEAVAFLEQYCELVYKIYETIAQENLVDILWYEQQCQELETLLVEINDRVKREVDLRYKAVFLPYRAKSWGAMESVWRAAKDDPNCDVYVIPIPYFYKKPDGSAGGVRYELEGYPTDVQLTRYDVFDFVNEIPEMMYIQTPYDEYDSCLSVHPVFYARNIQKYTEKLIYIPEIVLGEALTTDARMKINMKHCCVAPGVIWADRVIVQSESVRQMYIQILTEVVGEATRALWNEKIVGIGAPLWDVKRQTQKERELPEEWRSCVIKPNGEWKRIVLYRMNLGTLWEQGEGALQKLESVFEIFRERQSELVLLWLPEELTETDLVEEHFKVWERYCDLMEQFTKEGWGICNVSGDVDRAIRLCDAYYGDRNYIMHLCREAGVPVMMEAVDIR